MLEVELPPSCPSFYIFINQEELEEIEIMINEKCICGIGIWEGEELLRYFDGAERLLTRELCDYCYADIGVYTID